MREPCRLGTAGERSEAKRVAGRLPRKARGLLPAPEPARRAKQRSGKDPDHADDKSDRGDDHHDRSHSFGVLHHQKRDQAPTHQSQSGRHLVPPFAGLWRAPVAFGTPGGGETSVTLAASPASRTSCAAQACGAAGCWRSRQSQQGSSRSETLTTFLSLLPCLPPGPREKRCATSSPRCSFAPALRPRSSACRQLCRWRAPKSIALQSPLRSIAEAATSPA